MNATPEVLRHVLLNLLHSAPINLVFLAGLVLALVKWRRFPFPSLLLCSGCVLHLLVSIGAAFGYALLTRVASPTPALFTVFAIIIALLHAVSIGLLILAIYFHRPEPIAPVPPS